MIRRAVFCREKANALSPGLNAVWLKISNIFCLRENPIRHCLLASALRWDGKAPSVQDGAAA